ncbi:hypothetical protein TURU_014455 [Turdus rufiventris]|nr:hypothetical protein TURU_014455 [Turdus rufiventris]
MGIGESDAEDEWPTGRTNQGEAMWQNRVGGDQEREEHSRGGSQAAIFCIRHLLHYPQYIKDDVTLASTPMTLVKATNISIYLQLSRN